MTIISLKNINLHFPISGANTRSFKKKLFFSAKGTIAHECLKKSQPITTNEYMVRFERVNTPVPGLLIIVAYDPKTVEFSWVEDKLSNTFVFYFNKKTQILNISGHDDLKQYYAFYKNLPQTVPMC